MKKSLRFLTCELIIQEGMFDMTWWGSFKKLSTGKHEGACDIAGHIVRAAHQLGLPIPDATYDKSRGSNQASKMAKAARDIWASQYGDTEADRLQFTEKGWGWDLARVTAHEAIAHLQGAPALVHGERWTENDEDKWLRGEFDVT